MRAGAVVLAILFCALVANAEEGPQKFASGEVVSLDDKEIVLRYQGRTVAFRIDQTTRICVSGKQAASWRALSGVRTATVGTQLGSNLARLVYDGVMTISDSRVAVPKCDSQAAREGENALSGERNTRRTPSAATVTNRTSDVEEVRKAAVAGDATAMFTLAVMYATGRDINQDDAVAIEWLRKAAAAGQPNAMYALGLRHEWGFGLAKNETAAVEWYQKAAAAGNTDAQAALQKLDNGRRAVRSQEPASTKPPEPPDVIFLRPSGEGGVHQAIQSPTMKCPECEVFLGGTWQCVTRSEQRAMPQGTPGMCKSR